MSNLIKVDNDYKKWISEISKRFKQSQIKASVKANSEMLRFYWSLGQELIFYITWGHHVQIFGKCKGNTDKSSLPSIEEIEAELSDATGSSSNDKGGQP